MAFSAIIYDTHAQVSISGTSLQDFNEQLEWFRDTVAPADRRYDPDRKAWIVSPHEKYLHLPFMQVALENRRKQLSLFTIETG
ncbi:MAG: hypothetical protein AAGU17_00600 [Anaerolineaceae bacterium]